MDAPIRAHPRAGLGLLRRAVGIAIGATVALASAAPASAAPTPSITIGDVTLTEGNAGTTNATFTIQASPPPRPSSTLQVSWATASGTATAPSDFTASSGTVSLSKASPSRAVIVPVVGDTRDEANETFVVNLSNLVGSPGTIGDASATATITDDDPLPALSVDDVAVVEGNAGTSTATFTISLSVVSGRSVSVGWGTTAGTGTAGTDYAAASGSRTIAAGSTSATVGITVNGDALDEDDETFGITLSSPTNATIADATGAGTITDDDPLPVLSVNDVAVAEGNAGTSTATFTISLSTATGRSVSVAWGTTAGTATAGTDYAAASGSRTIAAGSTSATVGITVNGDALDEDDETFGITLSSPTNATIADATGAGTITDDDPLPVLSVNDVAVAEGNAGTSTLTFTVTLSTASGRTASVQWATADDEALSSSDYTAAAGVVTFVPGDTSEPVGVTLNGDLVAELDERFHLTLASPSNATVADGQGVGTILDDEGLPVLDIDAPAAAEGNAGTGALTFTISLSRPSALPVTVDWNTADGTGIAGEDFADASGTVSFAPLDTSETVVVDLLGESLYERDETVAVELSNATNAPIGRNRRFGTIVNDDAAPVLSAADVSVAEGNAGTKMVTVQVSLSAVSGTDALVGFAASDVTASAGVDYEAAVGTLTIPAGAASATVDVMVRGDTTFEPDETFSLTLSSAVDASIGDGDAVATIGNDDKAPTSLTLKVTRGRQLVTAAGVLEPTRTGHRVTVTLHRLRDGRFVRIAAKTVAVKNLRDRDGDGKIDGAYVASFTRPAAGGTYKLVARFTGDAEFKPSTKSKRFKLPPR